MCTRIYTYIRTCTYNIIMLYFSPFLAGLETGCKYVYTCTCTVSLRCKVEAFHAFQTCLLSGDNTTLSLLEHMFSIRQNWCSSLYKAQSVKYVYIALHVNTRNTHVYYTLHLNGTVCSRGSFRGGGGICPAWQPSPTPLLAKKLFGIPSNQAFFCNWHHHFKLPPWASCSKWPTVH